MNYATSLNSIGDFHIYNWHARFSDSSFKACHPLLIFTITAYLNTTSMKQTTINTSFPKHELGLYNEIMRISSITYTPPAMLIRQLSREALKTRKEQEQLVSV